MVNAKLNGKIAVIIGGSSWIGEAIAKKYANEGSKVIIAAPTLSKLEKTVADIKSDGGYAYCEVLDIRNESQVYIFLNKIEQKYNQIDILVNSAAIYPRSKIENLELNEWREVIDVNLTGAFIVLKYVSEIMKKSMNGKIIFISSVAGEKLGIPGLAHYSASKAGMNGLMRTAAIELAKYNININSINPGNIINHKRFNTDHETLNQMEQAIPVGRLGTPIDIANLAVFLASSESNFITGQDYTIDGGAIII